jgi:hypothetical protein
VKEDVQPVPPVEVVPVVPPEPVMSEEERQRLEQAYLFERELNEGILMMRLIKNSNMPKCFELSVIKTLYFLILKGHNSPDCVLGFSDLEIYNNLVKELKCLDSLYNVEKISN